MSILRSSSRTACSAALAALLLTADCALASAQTAPAADQAQPPAAVAKLYNTENAAVAARNYAAFVAPGTATFKKALTKALFSTACANVSDNLKTGITSQYDGLRTVQGATIYAWRVTCKNGVQYIAVMGVQGGKVAAFLYQPPPPAAK